MNARHGRQTPRAEANTVAASQNERTQRSTSVGSGGASYSMRGRLACSISAHASVREAGVVCGYDTSSTATRQEREGRSGEGPVRRAA